VSWDDVESWTVPDGARLAVRRAAPEGAPRGSIVIVHGWGEHSGRYAHVAAWLASQGLAVTGYDQRGHGRSSGRRGDVARFAQYLADIVALRKRVQAEVQGPQLLLGHSFGGLVVLRYLETAPEGLTGAVCTCPFIELATAPPRWKAALARAVVNILPSLRAPTGLNLDYLCTDPAVVEAARRDPFSHQVMTPRAYHEVTGALRALAAEQGRIAVPLLLALAGDDRVVSTPATLAFAAGLGGAVTSRVYPGLFHEILNERERDRAPVLADIGAWIDGLLGSREAA
jgi:alpha-beta hydrolase superfamily lysophospholipase